MNSVEVIRSHALCEKLAAFNFDVLCKNYRAVIRNELLGIPSVRARALTSLVAQLNSSNASFIINEMKNLIGKKDYLSSIKDYLIKLEVYADIFNGLDEACFSEAV